MIDPSIPLNVKPFQFSGFGPAYDKAASLRDVAQQRQLRGLQMKQAEQDIRAGEAQFGAAEKQEKQQAFFRQTVAKHARMDETNQIQFDDSAIQQEFLAAGLPELAQTWQSTIATRDQALTEGLKTRHERQKLEAQDLLRQAEAVKKSKKQTAWAKLRATILRKDPDAQIPPTFDPAVADALIEETNLFLTTEEERQRLAGQRATTKKAEVDLRVAEGGKLIDEYTSAEGRRVLVFQKPDGSTYEETKGVQGVAPKADEDPTTQERLAQLVTKRDTKGLTKEESAELRGIEYAMTLVAKTYGPGFRELTTPDGQTIYMHPSTGRIELSPAGTRPQFTAAEREEVNMMDEMLTQLSQLRTLAQDNPKAVGFGQGTVASARLNVTGGGGSEVAELFRIADGISDLLLRARSGAQINEQEYKRLRALTPNPRLSETKFFSDLDAFEAEVQRTIARRTGAAPLVTPGVRPGPESRGRESAAPSLSLDDALDKAFGRAK